MEGVEFFTKQDHGTGFLSSEQDSSLHSSNTSPSPEPQPKLDNFAHQSRVKIESYLPVGSILIERATGTDWVPIDHYSANLLSPKHPINSLIKADWVRGFVRNHEKSHDTSVIRVCILPDDVGRGILERGDRFLLNRLRQLVDLLDITLEAWEGKRPIDAPRIGLESYTDAGDSLFYLFNTIPSPDLATLTVACNMSQDAIHSLFEPNGLPGLKTLLYPYQKRSAATMIRREVQPRRSLDPRLAAKKGPLGHDFYYDSVTGQFFLNPRQYDEIKGGVLAESMGLGKTLICLATILATKGHWPTVPPEYSLGRHPVRSTTGSLMQMAAAAVGKELVPWRRVFQDLCKSGHDHRACVKILEENVGCYYVTPLPKRNNRRPSIMPEPEKVWLCSATIIIVPQNLLSQWHHEIAHHFVQDTFQVLSLDSKEATPMPKASQLMSYDIILITRQRVEQELCDSNMTCVCRPTSACDCRANFNYRSPLQDLHFLRVVVDEGHEFAGGKRNNSYFALAKIRVDRRWSVSGTPSSGLLGVEVGSAAYGASDGETASNAQILEARKKELGLLHECKDLDSLRIMTTGFLDVKPWSNSKHEDPASWSQYISPLKDGRRKPVSLRNLLNSVFVRHRIEDVEADVQLPPLYNRVVYLEPSWHDKLSQNAFIVTLIANAVTSERTDEDYMFHPKNRPALHQLINNMRMSNFYWTGFPTEEISKTLQVSCKYLEGHASLGPQSYTADHALLNHAIMSGEAILASPSFKVFSELHEMGVYIDDLPKEIQSIWSLVPREESGPTLLGVTQLCKAQKYVDTHLYEDKQLLDGLKNTGKSIMDKTWQELHRTQEADHERETLTAQAHKVASDTSRSAKKRKRTPIGQPKLTESFTVSKARRTLGSPRIKDSKNGHTKLQASPEGSQPPLKSVLKSSKTITPLDQNSCLYHSTLAGTASSKLSYLLDRVSVLHKEEKILIFYEGDHIAYYIAQAFDLIDVRYLIYTKSLDLALKSAYIATFNLKPTFRVLLMQLSEAAHGLHVASASRVFFVNPVWQPNIEAQAIKRAHRIGQTRPVYVETLILKNTLEDQMLKRRKGMTTQEHQKAERSLLDDAPMSAIIKNARLLPLPETDSLTVERQVAKLHSPIRLFGRTSNNNADPENPYSELIFPIETSKLNKLRVKRNTIGQDSVQRSDPDSPREKNRKLAVDDSSDYAAKNSTREFPSIPTSDAGPQPKKKRVGFTVNFDCEPASSPEHGARSNEIGEAGPSTTPAIHISTRRIGFDIRNDDTGNPESIFGP